MPSGEEAPGANMRATDFEFRYRVFFIMLIFWAGFACYSFDRVNSAVALARLLDGRGMGAGFGHGRLALHFAFAIAAALITAGAGMRTWGSAYLGREVVHDRALHLEKLVADGPYRHCRNPLYFGNILAAAGVAFMASRTGGFVLIAGMILFALRLIGREESGLLKAQGEAYRTYLAVVPRLWPALRPRVPSGGTIPQWGQALAGEAAFWITALAAVGYAAVLNLRIFFGIAGIAVAIFGLVRAVLKVRRPRRAVN
jgi:protein-S-isoprenylcysteine O-methyltransferase Ste14